MRDDDYRQTFQSDDAAGKYDQLTYAQGSYAAQVSSRQQRWLHTNMPQWFTQPPVQHDFKA